MSRTCSPPARRWFQFRLRTLLIAVAVLAVPMAWVGHSLNWIKQRRQMIREHAYSQVDVSFVDLWEIRFAPSGLWLFGEGHHKYVHVEPGFGEVAKQLFPEAHVWETAADPGTLIRNCARATK